MSNINANVKIEKIYDPRINVMPFLSDDENAIKYMVEQGSTVMSYQIASNTSTASNLIWNNIVTDPNNLLNSKMYISVPVRLTFTGTAPNGVTLLNDNTDAPRPMLSAIMSNLQLTLNNESYNSLTNLFIDALSRYSNTEDDLLLPNSISFSGSLDNDQTYDPTSAHNILGSWANVPYKGAVMPRGAYKDILYKIIENPVSGGVNPVTAVVDILFNEYLYISPLHFQKLNYPGLPNINSFSVQITLSPDYGLLWSHSEANGAIITNIAASFSNSNPTYSNTILHYYTLTVPKTMLLTTLDKKFVYNYNDIQVFTKNFGNINAGDSNTVTSDNIVPFSIPRLCYIYLEQSINTYKSNEPRNYLTIQDITINYTNQQGILSNVKLTNGQAGNSDLYNICVKNGCRLNYLEWQKYVGSVFCLNVAEDLNLSDMLSGTINNMNLQYSLTYKNNTGRNISGLTLYTVIVNEGVILIDNMKYSKQYNAVSRADVYADAVHDNFNYYESNENVDFMGGFSLKDLGNSVKKIGKSVVSGVQKALPYAKKGIEYTEKALPYVMPLLGLGDKERLADYENYLNSKGYYLEGAGVQGVEGAGFVAGQKAKKGDIKKRLKKYN